MSARRSRPTSSGAATARAGADEIAWLRGEIARQEQLPDDAAAAFIPLDERLHRSLAELAGTASAWEHLRPIKIAMDRVRYLTVASFPLGRLVAEHRQIVEAIAARDPDAAEAAIRRHLRGVLEDLPDIVAARPDHFDA